MRRLLKIEANKLLFYKSFWLFIGTHGCLFFLVALIMNNVAISMRNNVTVLSNTHIMSFPMIWQTLSWIGGWLHYLLGLLVILLVTNDFECRTIRQHIIDGMSRMQYIGGKLLVICCIGIYSCLMILLLGMAFGNNSPGSGPVFPISAAGFIFGSFIQGLGYMMFALLAAVYCKRAIIAVGVFLVWPIIAEPILGLLLDKSLSMEIAVWFPFHAISSIIPAPKSLKTDQLSLIPVVPVYLSMIYIIGMALLATLKIKTDDL